MRLHNDTMVPILAFTGAALAVIAQSDVPAPEVKVVSAAVAAGCTAVLAIMRRPGQPPPGEPRA